MTVRTGGPIRGLLGRWVMRFEAAGQMLSMVFQGTTAVSALSGVLAYTGFQEFVPYQQYVPVVLAVGVAGIFLFAYVYVELGVYNRKNREKQDRGNNFAKPQNRIDDEMIARGVAAGVFGRPLDNSERAAIDGEVDAAYRKFRDGVQDD
jgi:hypothetical protein